MHEKMFVVVAYAMKLGRWGGVYTQKARLKGLYARGGLCSICHDLG